jgi:class 3 adenylate cyclase
MVEPATLPVGQDVAPPPPALPRRRIRRTRWTPSRISIQSKLMVMLLVTSILSCAVVGAVGFQSGRNSLRASVFDRLTELRESQARAVEAQFNDLKSSLIIYSDGSTATSAMQAFSAGFDQLGGAPISAGQEQAIQRYYNTVFYAAEKAQTGNDPDIAALLPTSNAQKYLQADYTAPFPTSTQAVRNDDAHDGSAWSAANAKYNQFFRQIVTRFQFLDALLIDANGNVVYTAYKNVDLGTNILTGPYRGGDLTTAYQKAFESNALDYVGVTDFGDYQPADQPIAWLVTPVGTQDHIDGVLALQFPVSKINGLMTADQRWAAAGMGTTGETFLVGPDSLMRSDSRLFLQNVEEFKRDVIAAGTPPDVAEDSIRQKGTTLVQPVGNPAIRQAQQGQSGTLITRDYLGHDTLQAYAPVNLPGLNWVIVAKIDRSEAFSPVVSFTRTLVISTTIIIFVVCIAALILARFFVRPLRRLESGVQRISAGDYDVTLPVHSRDEFGDLTVAFNEMSRNLHIKDELLAEQRRENDRILLSLMPEAVLQRYREGEETIALDHRDATVFFGDIVGLEELSSGLSSGESLDIVNRLVRQFDAAADDLGVERVRTLHNGYLASCGLNVPRLDHVQRTVDFAHQMLRIIDRFNTENGLDLKLRAGIDTGAVSSGLIGRSSVVYDMWGAAVNLAYRVQSGFPQPGIYVTERVYETMRDTGRFTATGRISTDDGDEPVWRLAD